MRPFCYQRRRLGRVAGHAGALPCHETVYFLASAIPYGLMICQSSCGALMSRCPNDDPPNSLFISPLEAQLTGSHPAVVPHGATRSARRLCFPAGACLQALI